MKGEFSETTMNYTCGKIIPLRLTDLNPTCMDLVVVIQGYIVPVLAVFVVMVNSLIVIVFMKPRMRSHTTLILSLIAVVDMLNILFPSIHYVYKYSFNKYMDYMRYPYCKLAYFLADTSVDMLNMMSLWLTVLLAYIRSKCLKSPFEARRLHSGHKITICVTCIFIMAILIHIPSFFMFGFHQIEVHDIEKNKTEVLCGLKEANVTFSTAICVGRKLHILIESILNSIIPCIILGYYSVVMLVALREAKRCRSSLVRSTKESQSDKPEENTFCSRNNDVFTETEETGDQVKHTLTKRARSRNCSSNNTSTKWYKLCRPKQKCRSRSDTSDAAFDKLDRECRRTSCIVLTLASVIILHEIPLSIVNMYVLVTHTDTPLPLNIYGCMSTVRLLTQYLTYPIIFLIYTCMSSSFRSEIWKTLTCFCVKHDNSLSESNKVFLSPCSVRKLTREDTTLDHSHNSECDNV